MSKTRYWIARLKPLAQPHIALSMLCLGTVGIFAWTAWQYPELMSFTGINGKNERTVDDAANAENDAIGAEIDSLSLLNEATRDSPTLQPTVLLTSAPKTDDAKPQATTFNTSFLGATNTFPIPGAGPAMNFLDPTSNTLTSSLINPTNPALSNPTLSNPTLSNSTSTTIDQTLTTQAAQPFSLQPDPLPQPSSPTLGSWNQFPQTPNLGSTGLPTAGLPMPITQNQGSTGLPTNTVQPIPNSYTTLTNPSPYGLPIDAGVAPAVNPGVVAPVNIPIAAPIVPQVLPGADAPIAPVAPIQPDQVYTAPRQLPGKFIGGGNINTLSNP